MRPMIHRAATWALTAVVLLTVLGGLWHARVAGWIAANDRPLVALGLVGVFLIVRPLMAAKDTRA